MAKETYSKFRFSLRYSLLVILLVGLLLCPTGCSKDEPAGIRIDVTINVDSKNITINVAQGTNVQAAIQQAGIVLENLDRIDPPTYTTIANPTTITITRIREEFEVEENTIPFERQTMRNESLPEGQTMLIQPGINGIEQITYRRLYENGIEISRSPFKTTLLKEARPEIIMVGVQTPFTSLSIPGKLAYLTAGNAWIMENSTGQRRPVVTSGDLDGRVFNLSPDGKWLLYTRKAPAEDSETKINTLWMVNLSVENPEPVYLRVDNIIHFADWIPGRGLTIAYSTVEARTTPPGWQANNDLQILTVNETGGIIDKDEWIEANSGGIYGWWGTSFQWSPDGDQLAFSRPDSVGLVNLEEGDFVPLVELIPLQTRSDWAWSPGIRWSGDGSILYTVTHAPSSGLTSDETSPFFDLTAINLDEALPINLSAQAGMFAYPSPSPRLPQKQYWVAFLQAIFPDRSETSRYRLLVMDRDGSNQATIFPPEGQPGLDPQTVVWQPGHYESDILWIGFIYQGNLWLVNPRTQQAQQITGDGSIMRLDWK